MLKSCVPCLIRFSPYHHACRERTGGDSGWNNYLPGLPEFPTTIEMHSNAKQQGKAKSK